MEIKSFTPFKVGNVYNKLNVDSQVAPIYRSVTLEYPTRLNAMAIDPSGITKNQNMRYSPGEVVFSTDIKITVRISLIYGEQNIFIGGNPNRVSVVNHVCEIMKQALHYNGYFKVEILKSHDFRHCGLGSTGAIQAAVGAGINYMFNNPITKSKLVKYLAQNYGEEIDGDTENLMPVQCIGGSASSGIFSGGVLILAGESTVISQGTIGQEYTVVLGLPNDYKCKDSKTQFKEEQKNLDKFMKCGERYRTQIAYEILHKFLPAVEQQDVKAMGDVIFNYRYNMGSIENCAYTYEKLPMIMDKLKFLKQEDKVDVLSISSVGPLIFAIGKDVSLCIEEFKKNGLNTHITHINNESFQVIDQVEY